MFKLVFLIIVTSCAHVQGLKKEAKEWYSGPEMLKIQAEATNSNLEMSISSANEKLTEKVHEMGCDIKTGYSQTYYQESGNSFVATAVFDVPKDKCIKSEFTECKGEWVGQTLRSESEGLIRFPGVSMNESLSQAIIIAEGSALEYVNNDCKTIPSSTKFTERCISQGYGMYEVHVRASIEKDMCHSESESHQQLNSQLVRYRNMDLEKIGNKKTADVPVVRAIASHKKQAKAKTPTIHAKEDNLTDKSHQSTAKEVPSSKVEPQKDCNDFTVSLFQNLTNVEGLVEMAEKNCRTKDEGICSYSVVSADNAVNMIGKLGFEIEADCRSVVGKDPFIRVGFIIGNLKSRLLNLK